MQSIPWADTSAQPGCLKEEIKALPNTSIPSKELQRSESIHALRGLASLAVAWFHLTNGHDTFVKQIGSLGWLGVEVFFVISGFVIPLSIHSTNRPYRLSKFGGFLMRRMTRIEPPYIASALLVVVLWKLSEFAPNFSGKPYEFDLAELLAHIAYLIPLTDKNWLQPVYWTLAYEFAFYLFIGLCYPLVIGNRLPWLCLVTVLGVSVLFGIPPYWLLFAIGVAVFRAKTGKDEPAHLAAIIFILSIIMIKFDFTKQAIAATSTAAAIYFCYSVRFDGKIWRSLLWLGTISYSLYLTHLPIGGRVVNLGRRYLPADWSGELALSTVALMVSLVSAAVFHRMIERPAIKASRTIA